MLFKNKDYMYLFPALIEVQNTQAVLQEVWAVWVVSLSSPYLIFFKEKLFLDKLQAEFQVFSNNSECCFKKSWG